MMRFHFMLIFLQGAMTFGEEGKEGARVHDVKDIEAILDIFQAHGHNEVSQLSISATACLIIVSKGRYCPNLLRRDM
jgi:hypothetical protein